MAAAAQLPMSPEPRRFSIRLPRPLWIGLATGGLIVTAVALVVGVRICRHRAAVREVELVGGYARLVPSGPNFLRNWLGDEWTTILDTVIEVSLYTTQATDEVPRRHEGH